MYVLLMPSDIALKDVSMIIHAIVELLKTSPVPGDVHGEEPIIQQVVEGVGKQDDQAT